MTQSRLARFAPLAGILSVALFIATFIVVGEGPAADDSVEEVVSFYQDNETELFIATLLGAWASVLLAWFGSTLRAALRTAAPDSERLAVLAFAGFLTAAIGFAIFTGLAFAGADVADEVPDPVAPEVLQMISVLSSDLFMPLAVGWGIAFLATAIAALRHGGLPRWLGIIALIIGIVAITPLGFFAIPAGGIWIAIVSVMLFTQPASEGVAS